MLNCTEAAEFFEMDQDLLDLPPPRKKRFTVGIIAMHSMAGI